MANMASGTRKNPDEDDGPVDMRPFLSIPYWLPIPPADLVGDNGTIRPLPSTVPASGTALISWLCQGIHASPYVVGQPLDVQVDVHNDGAGNTTSLATVLVYWCEPVAGGLSNARLFGAQSVPVPPRGAIVATPVITGTVP